MAGNNSNNSSDWHLNVNNITNTSIGITTMSNSAPILDSFCPPIWDQSSNMNTMLREAMFVPTSPMMVPPSLTPFPADSAFIQRAARFSCFNGGNFSEMVNPFSSHPDESRTFKNEKKIEQFTQSPDEAKNGVDGSDNQCDEAEFSGKEEISGKGQGLNKRKRIEYKENNGEAAKETDEKQTGHPNPFSNGNGKPGSDPPKEEYIHVRARRGQATNSHSLAERVRREKISERMKFLQDIVPGCGKVTGKAVMLDEIINYVQSLQRQVEFLSMKLATVNPQLDVNMETFLSKDIPQARASTLAFPPDMTMSYPPQHGIIQASLSGMRTSSEALLRQPNSQHMQAHNVWPDELHDIFHNGFNSSSPNAQDLSVSLPPGQSKTEL